MMGFYFDYRKHTVSEYFSSLYGDTREYFLVKFLIGKLYLSQLFV